MNSSDYSAMLATCPDSTLEVLITGLQEGTINVPEMTATDRLACIRVAQIEAARRKARKLIEELGQDHPRAFAAMLDFVELADPGATERALRESGFNLPAPTHVDGDGNTFYTSEAIADALNVPHEQVMEDIEQMCQLAPEFAPAAGELHRIQ